MAVVKHPPNWGLDPVLNPDFRPIDPDAPDVRAQYIKMADTIKDSLHQLPDGWDAYASYVDHYGGFPELVKLKGGTGAFLLSITVVPPGHPARCGDVEDTGLRPSDLPHWLNHVVDASPPWVYTSAGNWAACNEYIGGRHVIRWAAHWIGWHICGPNTCGYPQADITQCFNSGPHGENYDRSLGFAYVITRPPPDPAWPQVSRKSHGENVRTVQYLLNAHGAHVVVTGEFDANTEQAVNKFKTACDLPPDGVVGPRLWPKVIITVQEGSRGDAVRAAQSQMNTHGNHLAVDGEFGPATKHIVELFQAHRGLERDGIVGEHTWRWMVAG